MDARKAAPGLKGIVGIGASAGGLEALSAFVGNIAADTGLCFVVVQHLAPDHPSIMDQLLAEHTELPVVKIENGMRVAPNKVFVIPPGPSLTVSDGRFHLEPRDNAPGMRTPIDKFFTSLADEYTDEAACVILSGTGSDGTIGLRAIKSHGGIAVVQDSATARFSGMPDSASATGIVDLVLEPKQMPRRLLEVLQHRHDLRNQEQGDALLAAISERLPEILALIAEEDGHDFGDYKEGTLLRRVERRMVILRLRDLDDMIGLLKESKEERTRLLQDFLIGVTHFFRDKSVFDTMADTIIPGILDRNQRDVRVWVPGCSTGEEAYSLAILFCEEMRKRDDKRKLQIFGTDVDMGALRAARTGHYAPSAVLGVDEAVMERYFHKKDEDYIIRPFLRENVIFAPHNLLTDPPFSNVDLVSCRNLMIYLNQAAQRSALSRFHYALRSSGILLLGPSETVRDHEDFFEPVHRNHRIFKRDSSRSMGYSAIAGAMDQRLFLRGTPRRPQRSFCRDNKKMETIVDNSFAAISLGLATLLALVAISKRPKARRVGTLAAAHVGQHD